MKKIYFLLSFIACVFVMKAQELNCNVEILVPKLQVADPAIFKTLQTDIVQFMNNQKWTEDEYKPNEKIEISILINVTDELSANSFKGQITVRSLRPVYNSDYNTALLNHIDKDFSFSYIQHQPLQYTENTFINNITSVLAFYAYLAIGLDYDSFSPKGGQKYYLKAQNIVQTAQNSTSLGWKSFEKNNRNRYWIIDNMLNSKYSSYRDVLYKYHLKGLDEMSQDADAGRAVIMECIKLLYSLNKRYPNFILRQFFFNAKAQELLDIYSKAPDAEKREAVNMLVKLDIATSQKYKALLK